MGSWIYLYSKFSQEALILWGALACVLGATYSVFWILKKRRFGVASQAIPSTLVKGYLNELIAEARVVRGQLFGMTEDTQNGLPPAGSARGIPEPSLASQPATAAGPVAGEGTAAVNQLQSKTAEQEKQIQSLAAEKAKLEQELAAAKAATPAPTPGVAPTAESIELKRKVKDLEDRLSEYSIIEDDLANLKRLQQENEEMKKKLGLSAAASPPAPAPTPEPTPVEAAPAPAPAAPPAAFEKVVDQVEASLAATPAPVAAPAAEATPTEAPANAAAPAEPKKSDEDLLSEFEKMLGG